MGLLFYFAAHLDPVCSSWSLSVEHRLHQTLLGVLVSCVMHEAARIRLLL